MDTKSLRRNIQKHRRNLSITFQQNASQKATKHLASHLLFQQSHRIAFYVAVNGEIDPKPLLQIAQELGKMCYLPVIDPSTNNRLKFIEYHPENRLVPNKYGIPEPMINEHKQIEPELLDLVITPLIAFDEEGHRVGTGAGYYDRTFAFLKETSNTKLAGFAYEFQKINLLIPQPWDIALNMVVSEECLYAISSI